MVDKSTYLGDESESAVVAVGSASGDSWLGGTQGRIVEEPQGGLVADAKHVRVLRQKEIRGLLQPHGKGL